MKKYRDAFENLKVPDDMAVRIQRELAEDPQKVVPLPKQKTKKGAWTAAAVCAACLALIIGVWKTSDAAHPPLTSPAPPSETVNPGESVTIQNPMQEVSSPEDFSKYLTFTPRLPSELPAGYQVSSCCVIGGELAEAVYSDGTTEVTYRTAQGTDDVSGDYNAYPETNQKGAYTLCGSDGAVALVKWTDGGYSFSLSFSPAVIQADAVAWAQSVK